MNSNQWPRIIIPDRINIAEWMNEKFSLYSKLLFLVDDQNDRYISYGHVYDDIHRLMNVFRKQKISSKSTIAIITNSNDNSYEHIITLMAILMIGAKLVIFDHDDDNNLTNEQLQQAIKQCNITNLVVISSSLKHHHDPYNLCEQFKSHFSVWFGEKNRQQQQQQQRHTSINTDEQCDNNIRYYMLDISKDYSRFNLDNEKSGQTMRKTTATKTCRIIVAKFKAKTIITKLYNIDDFDLFLQLTYATLPECGFEWNMNDIILNMNGMSNLISILELLIILSIGAQFIINTGHLKSNSYGLCIDRFVNLINKYNVTTCLLNSHYLIDLLKWPSTTKTFQINSLTKILHFSQPFHSNIIKDLRNRFEQIQTCRFVLYSLDSNGFAMIQSISEPISYMEPWPMIEIKLLDWNTDNIIDVSNNDKQQQGQPGHLYIRFDCQQQQQSDWINTGFIGFYDYKHRLQIIDRNKNFIKIQEKRFSKTLIETILLSLPSIQRASVKSIIDDDDDGQSILTIDITMNESNEQSNNTVNEFQKQLQHYFDKNIIEKFKFNI
uniref:Uncharacterized protein LOC113791703 n=1 Tax=Dermatophagoides pteronyssinus TaxID=6956 RepID=A0A6P6XZ86_DERPT